MAFSPTSEGQLFIQPTKGWADLRSVDTKTGRQKRNLQTLSTLRRTISDRGCDPRYPLDHVLYPICSNEPLRRGLMTIADIPSEHLYEVVETSLTNPMIFIFSGESFRKCAGASLETKLCPTEGTMIVVPRVTVLAVFFPIQGYPHQVIFLIR